MAFEEFGQLSKRRRAERAEEFRKRIIISILSSVLLLACIAGGAFAYIHIENRAAVSEEEDSALSLPAKGGSQEGGGIQTSNKIVEMLCSATDYRDKCKGTLSKVVQSNTNSVHPKAVIKAVIKAASDEISKASKKVASIKFSKPEERAAYEVCKKQFRDALEELEESISHTVQEGQSLQSKLPDLKTWLSAAISYQEICVDAFPPGDTKKKIRSAMNSTEEFISNSLAVVSQISTFLSKFKQFTAGRTTGRRRLVEEEWRLPRWMGREERKLLVKATANINPNLTVAKDGSGNFTTINDALKAIPENRNGRIYIYVKEGVYEEYVSVTKKMANVTMYGDGSNKTIITGNKNFVDGVPTYLTATFAAIGEGFIGIALGFRNTAGPEKHQAVALRVQSDKAIFLSCRMEGYQDTLYAQAHRQFYRSCQISGTVDFIFGDAAAIFQNCAIVVRKPMDNQRNIVTAQGRIDKRENTGIILHNCRIEPDTDLQSNKQKIKTYLGRPWKQYSRTIIMESTIGDLIQPEGWLPWAGDFALKTLFYAEYENHGPGANTSKRVKWVGYKKPISKHEAHGFTIMPFLQGSWIRTAGVPIPVQYGFYK